MERQKETLAREKEELEAEIQALRTARADRQAIRAQLDRFIAQGNALAEALNRTTNNIFDQHTDVIEWVRDAHAYVGTDPLNFSAWLIQELDIQDEVTIPFFFALNSREARERRGRDTARSLARMANPEGERARLQQIIRTINERLSELLHRQRID